MEGEREEKVKSEQIINVEKYRRLVKSYIDLHLYSAALFWADKVVSLSNGEARDVYWLAQCMFLMKQYHRAAHLIRSRGLEKTHVLCHYLAVRCLLEARELSEALEVLTDAEKEGVLFPNMCTSFDSNVPAGFDDITPNLTSSVLFLKGRVYEAMDNRGLAADCYKQALRSDVHCYEAFEALVQHQMLSAQEEQELLESLPASRQCIDAEEQLLRLLYESKLKKYQSPSESLPPPPPALASNLDVAVAQAERHYYNCNYQQCSRITEEVLKKDPYHSGCLPVHISCLVELKKVNKLFYLAHRLVDLHPEMAIAWYAVGCYYYVIGKSDPARRYLSKSTALDKLFSPAWLAYGHSFAAENEHDQAMAAYFKASQLMKGCHLPLLYIGLECGLTNNVKLADKFFLQSQSIAPQDPFVIHEMGVICFQNQALSRLQAIKEPVLPNKWEPLFNNLGHTYRKLQKYEDALEYHRQALVLSPSNPSTYSAIGFIHAIIGNTDEAVDAFHKALGLRRDDTFSTTMLSYVIEQLAEETPPFQGAPKQIPPFDFPTPMPPLTVGKTDVSAVNLDSVTTPGCSDTILSNGTPQYEVDMQDSSLEEARHDVT
ncbi:cell division cycle protein 16 homolog isoform X2 [Cryptotermes secundus]|uniref:cell division cycle protein 16 homolog isoform X2 n=1 Tax=Cryptotermes secundus TaxID=105785 RepID=UPI000CD7B544|nr:cell division cycle protein 16 homolog isoform X2 [Cryptotermes secundus]